MNKIKITLFLASLLMCVGVSRAQSVTVDDIVYDISSGEAVITDVLTSGYITIPVYIAVDDELYHVGRINSGAFPAIDDDSETYKINFETWFEQSLYYSDEIVRICSMTFGESWISSEWELLQSNQESSIEIPGFVDNIPDYAFEYCSSISVIYMTEGDYEPIMIGNYAFYNCKNVENVYMFGRLGTHRAYRGILSIGTHAFDGCASNFGIHLNFDSFCKISFEPFWSPDSWYLSVDDADVDWQHDWRIVVPDNIESINDYAFEHCKSQFFVEMSNSIKRIGNYAFHDCNMLRGIKLPDSLESIGDYAFYGDEGPYFSSVELPISITSIGDYAFAETRWQLTKFPESLQSIGDGTFLECSLPSSIDIQDVTYIGNCTFSGTDIKSVKLSNLLVSIGDSAFSNCMNLESIEIPNSVVEIGKWAFADCKALTSVKLSDSITKIQQQTFLDCENLVSIEIPNSVKEIEYEAFCGNKALTSINIPPSLEKIACRVFWGCNSLASIEIPNSVTTIENQAFYKCTSLTSINIPESVKYVDNNAFQSCAGLKTVKLPQNLIKIGQNAFSECEAIEHIEYLSENPRSGSTNLFSTITYDSATLYIPAGTKDKYLAIDPWKNFKNIMEVVVTGIDDVNADDSVDEIDYSQPYEVFNFTGIRLNESIDGLHPGMYIIRQGNTVKKLKI